MSSISNSDLTNIYENKKEIYKHQKICHHNAILSSQLCSILGQFLTTFAPTHLAYSLHSSELLDSFPDR